MEYYSPPVAPRHSH